MEIEEGTYFSSMDEAKNEIKKFCITNFHQYQVKYSSTKLFTVVCKGNCCPFIRIVMI